MSQACRASPALDYFYYSLNFLAFSLSGVFFLRQTQIWLLF